jgi:RNA polymerase sigma-70 factor (ECF subfamily)
MSDSARFRDHVLPHLDAAANLARWLARNPHDADDVVQEACARALRYIGGLREGEARAWFLTIVRHAFYDWCARNRAAGAEPDGEALLGAMPDPAAIDPQEAAVRAGDARQLAGAVAALPPAFREVLVLRELEDCSYREIAAIVGVPVGTVMSRLARARSLLRLSPQLQEMRGSFARGLP